MIEGDSHYFTNVMREIKEADDEANRRKRAVFERVILDYPQMGRDFLRYLKLEDDMYGTGTHREESRRELHQISGEYEVAFSSHDVEKKYLNLFWVFLHDFDRSGEFTRKVLASLRKPLE